MPVAQGELIQVTVRYLVDGQTCENVLHFRERTPNTLPANIDADIKQFMDKFRLMQAAGATYLQPMWKQLTPVVFDSHFTDISPIQQGNISGDCCNTTIAAVGTLRTGVAGKKHRGRVYVGGLPDALGTTNRLTTGDLNTMQGAANDIMTLFDDAAGTALYLALGIYSRLIGGTKPYTIAGWQPVIQWAFNPILANQRRRRVTVGI